MFTNQYADIADGFSVVTPMQFPTEPKLLLFNSSLFEHLELNWSEGEVEKLFSGMQSISDVPAAALAYSGHQFGHFNPTLGDGRAHYLGTTQLSSGEAFDLQLKGSGATPFSRGGDGLCALGPAVREFIMSHALKALGVNTTECLAVVATGDQVYRQGYVPGAVVCRVASSHIRVGSFQYLALKQDAEGIRKLLELAIKLHYPHIEDTGNNRVFAFLEQVCRAQVELVIDWMRVGFIHGVMNTDNCLISGETIDYGPCAMMEKFSFESVFSSIDRQGRYAYGNQPNIVQWNCARLAESLLLLTDGDEQEVIEQLSNILKASAEYFNERYINMWGRKLGFIKPQSEIDSQLLSELLTLMHKHQLDYTNTFAALTLLAAEKESEALAIPSELQQWVAQWQARVACYDMPQVAAVMAKANPMLIPRNELVERVIEEFYESGESKFLTDWLKALNSPYDFDSLNLTYIKPQQAPEQYQTFCGT